MKVLFLIAILFTVVSCRQHPQEEGGAQETKTALSITLDKSHKDDPFAVYDFEGFQKLFLHQKDNQIHVLNFWATFCPPCIKELPYFKRLDRETDAKVLMVDLDMGMMMDTQLKPYLKKHPMDLKLIVLDDPESQKWIPKVSPTWNSSLPATLIYKNDRTHFFEKPFHSYAELLKEVNKFN